MLNLGSLLLGNAGLTIGLSVGIVVAFVLGGLIGWLVINKLTRGKLGSVQDECERMRNDARSQADAYLKESRLEISEERQRMRSEIERERRDSRAEQQRAEHRLSQREDQIASRELLLDKKSIAIDEQKSELEAKQRGIAALQEELAQAHEKMSAELQRVSGMTAEEAKQILMEQLLDEVRKDAAVKAKEIEQAAKDEADKKAKNIIALAVQRCAADHASEISVSTVTLPGDDMKGRLIGRVGRNIRAIENSTGVDLIIDDTPDVVTVSAFDPVRREIAKLAIEKLVSDGRIHPARIEETVDKVKRELEAQMKQAGEDAAFDANVLGLHSEIIRLLGRLKYRTSYGQNVLKHSLEVSYLAGAMASELGADVKLCRRAGLLHDIGKAIDHEVEGTHISIGVELCKKFRENPAVIHAIEAHHGDVEARTLEAVIVQSADAISGARPGARRESVENYVRRLEKIENVANSFAGVEQSYAIQAGREIRVIVKPEEVDDSATMFMAKEIARKLEAELDYPGQIKVNVIRELRSVEYAK
ncbi:MAG: ribonuclease Y [Clostridia bacterium]|nr:ribonuclease Y [Clostridia bacterium]